MINQYFLRAEIENIVAELNIIIKNRMFLKGWSVLTFYTILHFNFFRLLLSLPRPFAPLTSSFLRARISRIKSKNTYNNNRSLNPTLIHKTIYTKTKQIICHDLLYHSTHLINIISSFSWCLDIWHAPFLGSRLSFIQWYFSFICQIPFVTHQQKRYVFVVLYSQNLFSKNI